MRSYFVQICAAFCRFGLCWEAFDQAQTFFHPDRSLLSSYDYVIAGGGLSGLVVATRLAEDSTKTVLVIEHGYFDEQDPGVLVPGLTRMGALGMKYMFNYTTVPQPGLNNRTASVWAANVVGGGSTVNGMVFPRGATADYDAWEKLGNQGWAWKDILPYFKKSETFIPPLKHVEKEFSITYNESAHGTDGPISSSYPRFLWPSMKNYFRAWKELGIAYTKDGNDGKAIGTYWMPNSLNPTNQSRSYARQMYYDPVKTRPNLHILTGHIVNRVLFDDELLAIGATFISREDKTEKTVQASREVVLAAGTVHSPGILQRSGIGSEEFLNSLGIKALVDLPGVGQNLQDHPALHFVFMFTKDLFPNPSLLDYPLSVAQQVALYYNQRDGLFTNNRGIALTMLPLQNMTSKYQQIIADAWEEDPAVYLPPGTDGRVLEGFKAQREILLDHFGSLDATALEITYEGRAEFDAALQRPLSRGTVLISTSDPFAPPDIDYRVLSGSTDLKIAIEAVRLARKFMLSPAMQELGATELSPGATVESDEEIEAMIRSTLMLPTFGHISGSCAMQKQSFGGVVSPRLSVHGVKGLRVVDGSIMPLVSTTHLQATIYAIAEKAAAMIKEDALTLENEL